MGESVTNSQSATIPADTINEPLKVVLTNGDAAQTVQAFFRGGRSVAAMVDENAICVHPSNFMTVQVKRSGNLIMLANFGIVTLEVLSVEKGIVGVPSNLTHGKVECFRVWGISQSSLPYGLLCTNPSRGATGAKVKITPLVPPFQSKR